MRAAIFRVRRNSVNKQTSGECINVSERIEGRESIEGTYPAGGMFGEMLSALCA